MGFFDNSYEAAVRNAEDDVRRAEEMLAYKKRARDNAKKGTSYRNASKTYVEGGKKILNEYDYQIYIAQRYLKEAKERLAKAKEKARDAKKREQEKAKEAKKREQEAAKKAAVASRAAASLSRVSSTSSSVKSSAVSASVAASLPKSSTSYSKQSTNTHSEQSHSKAESVSSHSTKSNGATSSKNKSKGHSKKSLIFRILFALVGVYLLYLWYDSYIQWWDTIWQILCYVFVFPYIVCLFFFPLINWLIENHEGKD